MLLVDGMSRVDLIATSTLRSTLGISHQVRESVPSLYFIHTLNRVIMFSYALNVLRFGFWQCDVLMCNIKSV